jgi:hypothetical protein
MLGITTQELVAAGEVFTEVFFEYAVKPWRPGMRLGIG